MTWLILLAALALFLGLFCDYGNFMLRRAKQRGERLQTSPVVLAPLLLNWCGLALLFAASGFGSFVWLLAGLILLAVLHVFCLRGFAG